MSASVARDTVGIYPVTGFSAGRLSLGNVFSLPSAAAAAADVELALCSASPCSSHSSRVHGCTEQVYARSRFTGKISSRHRGPYCHHHRRRRCRRPTRRPNRKTTSIAPPLLYCHFSTEKRFRRRYSSAVRIIAGCADSCAQLPSGSPTVIIGNAALRRSSSSRTDYGHNNGPVFLDFLSAADRTGSGSRCLNVRDPPRRISSVRRYDKYTFFFYVFITSLIGGRCLKND